MSTKIANAFLDRLQRSGLLTGDKLSQAKQSLEAEGVDLEDASAIAKALVARGDLTEWQTDKLLQGKHKGFFLGSYRLLRPLGRGGMGAVFLAAHEMMRRQCAIKVLPYTQIKEGTSVLDRFYVEAQAVAALDHQNIVRAYDVNKEVKDNKEIHYLVMEYVEGQDAQATVQKHGPMECVKAAEFLRQTANGLAHAHENGLIHRDIKPANLLIDNKGVIKILDLGLARFFDEGSEAASLTAAHNETVLGTADYLSPEQALNSHNVDHRTDIYSLGCTAYFLLTGHPPFPEGSVAQRLVAHQVKTPKPLTEERPDTPRDLAAIIERMMAKKPEDRFDSAHDVAKTLSAWLIEHGGDDWRRQHSEISGDSTLLKMLTQPHEPTRSFASSGSETELELAPLDDADGYDDAAGVSGGSASDIRQPLVSSEPVLGMKDLDDGDDGAAQIDADSLPPLDASEAEDLAGGTVPVDLNDLSDLPDAADLSSLDEQELTAGMPATPLGGLEDLDGLAHEDPLAVPTGASSGSLGAIDSHIRRPATRGTSSSIHRRADSKRGGEPKKQAGGLSVGLPIIIGVGGGLVLVLVIIGILAMTNSSESDVPRNSRPERVASVTNQPADPGRGGSQPDAGNGGEKDKPEDRPGGGASPNKDKRRKGDGRGKAAAQAKGAATSASGSGSKPPRTEGTPKDPPRPSNERDSQDPPQAKAGEPQLAKRPVVPDATEQVAVAPPRETPPETTDDPPAADPQSDEPPPAYKVRPEPPKTTQNPAIVLAGIETMGVRLLVNGEPAPANSKNELLFFIMLNLRNIVENRLRMKFDEKSEENVMVLNLSGEQDGDLMRMTLSAELQCKTDQEEPLVVWSGEVDLQPYKGRPTPVMFDIWKKNVGSLYGDFEGEYRRAQRQR